MDIEVVEEPVVKFNELYDIEFSLLLLKVGEEIVVDFIVGVGWLFIEHIKDVARYWWRWSICCELDPTKKDKIEECFWWRRMVYGGYESMRVKRRRGHTWCKRSKSIPTKS